MRTNLFVRGALAAGLLSIAPCPSVEAQAPGTAASQVSRAPDLDSLTDVRVEVVKAALQLRPEQENLWPAVEDAIRARAKNRQNRLSNLASRAEELGNRTPLELLCERDPVSFLQRRADALGQRAADLKKLADAWQPLYGTLTPDQKMRMAFLTIYVLRELRGGLEQRLLLSEGWDEE